jgi:REP element-mobilizing transposase RayT
MPDHLHLVLLGLGSETDTWEAIRTFKQYTGYWFYRQQTGFRWQKDFYDRVIRSDRDFQIVVKYIANNPVQAGLAARWDRYPFTGSIQPPPSSTPPPSPP